MIINENGWGNKPQPKEEKESVRAKSIKLNKVAKELRELDEAVQDLLEGEESAEQE